MVKITMASASDMEANNSDEENKMVFHKSDDKTVNTLINKFSQRAANSNRKHGNKIHQVKKPVGKWVTEALEEAMDEAVYLQRLEGIITEISLHLEDLGWEADRMSSCGKQTLKILWEYFDIPWDEALDKGEKCG